MKKNLIALLISFLSIPIVAGISSADVFYFNDSNVFGGWEGDNSSGYGSIEITQHTNRLDFVVTANQSYFYPKEPGLIWDNFKFNGLIDITTDNITILEDGSWTIRESNPGPYKTFDFLLKGTSIDSNDVDPLEFSINLENISIADVSITNLEGWMFAGHLKGFDLNGTTSTWLASSGNAPTPVPIPPSVILFGSALVCLVGIRQRKGNSGGRPQLLTHRNTRHVFNAKRCSASLFLISTAPMFSQKH